MFGGFERCPLAFDVSAPPAEVPLDRSVLTSLTAQVSREVPAARGEIAEHRGGMFTMSPDGRFVLGPVPRRAWPVGRQRLQWLGFLLLARPRRPWPGRSPARRPYSTPSTPARFGATDDND